MKRRAPRWLRVTAYAALLASGAILSCSSFEEGAGAPPDASPDASADAPSPAEVGTGDGGGVSKDGGPDAPPPCVKALAIDFREAFPGPALDGKWLTEHGSAGQLAVGVPPSPSPPDGGTALLAASTVDAGSNGGAFGRAIFSAVPPLRSVDLSYDVLIAPNAFYAELGCDILIYPEASGDLVRFALERAVSGALSVGFSKRIGPLEASRRRSQVGVSVAGAPEWLRVELHVDMSLPDRAHVTMAVERAASGGAPGRATLADLPLLDGLDTVVLRCGVPFADQSEGVIDVAVDDVVLTACPR